MSRKIKTETLKAIIVGLAGNTFLMAFKLFAGIYGRSQTMVADSINHMGDILTDVALLFGAHFWTAPPDDTHQHGHRRIETFITIIIGAAISFSAVIIGYNAIITLNDPHKQPTEMIALVAAVVSILLKEALFRFTDNAGKKIKSPALMAKALDHRADAAESALVSIAVAVSIWVPQWTFVDHIGALIVSIFVFSISMKIIWPAFQELTDAGACEDFSRSIKRICLAQKGVKSMHKLKTRRLGSLWAIELHIQVNGRLTVKQGHDIAGAVKHALLKSGNDITDVTIHIEPYR